MKISRRSLVLGGTAVATAIAIPAFSILKNRYKSAPEVSFQTVLPIPQLLDAREFGNSISLAAAPSMAKILPGLETPAYGYLSTFLGPVIRVYRGDTIAMNLTNGLNRPTTVYWHGLRVSSEVDGGSYHAINPGETWRPSLEIDQPAATTWYRPDLHGDTGRQVYMGLAGLLYVEDGMAQKLGVPVRYGIDDIPLILQDRSFNRDGTFSYDTSPMGIIHGSRGDTIIVNGAINPTARVPRGVVRLRVLNASNARNFKLRFDDTRPFAVIASDNGFIVRSVLLTELIVAPGERYEVLVDFADGGTSILQTYPDHKGRFGSAVMQRLKSIAASFTADLTPFMRFVPDAFIEPAIRSLPEWLADIPDPIVEAETPRRSFILDSLMLSNAPIIESLGGWGNIRKTDESATITDTSEPLSMDGIAAGIQMGINGRPFDMNRVDAEVKLGGREIWDIRGTEMAHPFHIHGASFRILNMDGASPPAHLAGWKDTILVNEGAQLLVLFNNRSGPAKPFTFNCQILEHQDAGMMGQYVAT